MADGASNAGRESLYYVTPLANIVYAYVQKRAGKEPRMNMTMLAMHNTMFAVVSSSAVYVALDALHLI